MTELVTGQVPDILDLDSVNGYALPFRQLAEKGYLEDLLPWIDGDPELKWEDLMEPLLKAAMADGGLYFAFEGVLIETLAGPERIVGKRYSWTLPELLDAISTMPEGATISEYYHTKSRILTYLMNPDSYVDWETGECFSDSENFRMALELANTYPLEVEEADFLERLKEMGRRRRSGLQMLTTLPVDFDTVRQMEEPGMGFGEPVAFPGYPRADGRVGSHFAPVAAMAMSSVCENKEAAWEFIRESFLPRCSLSVEELIDAPNNHTEKWELTGSGLPINRADFELLREYEMTLYHPESLEDYPAEEGYRQPMTEEMCRKILDFYNQVEEMRLGGGELLDIIEEQCGPYFAGDRSLDETVDQIQRRVALYINENR